MLISTLPRHYPQAMTQPKLSSFPRRQFLGALAGAGALAALTLKASAAAARPGRLKQAVCRGVFKDLNEKLAKAAALSFDQVRDIAEGIDKFA